MKLLLLALFASAAAAGPLPDAGPVEVLVHGVAEGQALDLGDILDIAVKEHVDGQIVSASNALHPFTAEGIAEAAAAAEADLPTGPVVLPEPIELPAVVPEPVELPEPSVPIVVPEPIVLPDPAVPEVVPEPVELPEPAVPEVAPEPVELPEPAVPEVAPEPVELPEPAVPEVAPEPVELPEPAVPEVAPEPVELPEPAVPEIAPEAPTGELFNDGTVSVTLNAAEPGLLSTLQSWFNFAFNYVTSAGVTSQQIV